MKADHFQVLVGGAARGPLVDTTALWYSGHAIPRVDAAPYLVALPIARYGGDVSIRFEVASDPSTSIPPGWTMLGTFEVDVPSGERLA